MTSLFSPFDMVIFSIPFLFLFFVLISLFSFMYKFNLYNSALNWVSISLVTFFMSLKPKYFTKSNVLFFLGIFFMLTLTNFSSVLPFNFPLTSQVSLVLGIGGMFWVSLIIFSFINNSKGFFSHFVPEGSPLALSVFLFLIEMVSAIIRPITLTVRLVANILAGHLLMILLSSLVFFFNFSGVFYLGLNLVEMFVALIQAYIFTTMIVLYFSEV